MAPSAPAPFPVRLAVSAPVGVRDERPDDVPAREALLDDALPGRHASASGVLRTGRRPTFALVAIDPRGTLVGTVRLWNVDAGGVPALLLGPLAVSRSARGDGVGARLMRAAIERARRAGHRAVLLVGDAPYYERFGFGAAPTGMLDLPGPVERARFLALELVPSALAGARGPVVATGAVRDRRRALAA